MRSNARPAHVLILALLPLVGACNREPAESNVPATASASATSAASAASAPAPAPGASQPALPLGSEPGVPGAAVAAPAVPRSTAIASGHILLTGGYEADTDAEVSCHPADTALQLTFFAPGKPRVFLLLDNLAAKGTSGTYKGQVTIGANDPGESSLRQSQGKASAEITVEAAANGNAVSGSFATTTYKGDAGKGTVQGRFERCVYKPEPADHP